MSRFQTVWTLDRIQTVTRELVVQIVTTQVMSVMRIVIMRQNNLHWQLEENCEKPESGKLGHSLAQVAQVAKVQSDHLLHDDHDDCDDG